MKGPFKGIANSYDFWDEDMFFGRGVESAALISRIMSSELTFLYSVSGAGKTSLIRAKVVPALQRKGWSVGYYRLTDQPVEGIIDQIISTIVPSPEYECEVLNIACECLQLEPKATSIFQLATSFQKLDQEQKSVIENRLVTVRFVRSTNHTEQVLRKTLRIREYVDHINALIRMTNHRKEFCIESSCSISEIIEKFSFLKDHYDELKNAITPRNRKNRLRETLVRIYDLYAVNRYRFKFLILIDQFEELFTNFPDNYASGIGEEYNRFPKHAWKKKKQFLEELGEAVELCMLDEEHYEPYYSKSGCLPIKFVFAMREEYLSQLDTLRGYIGTDYKSYRLGLLDRSQAMEAISIPVLKYQAEFNADCLKSILDDLESGEGFINPSILQVICSKVWESHRENIVEGVNVIGVDSYQDKPIDEILDEYVEDAFAVFDSPETKFEACHIFDMLLTQEKTRNIVSTTDIFNATFRSKKLRSSIVKSLESTGLIRLQDRLGTNFTEIYHELLIDTVLKYKNRLFKQHHDLARFYRGSFSIFTGVASIAGATDPTNVITKEVYEELDSHKNLKSIDFNDRIDGNVSGVELMYRLSIEHSENNRQVEYWTGMFSVVEDLGLSAIPEWIGDGKNPTRNLWINWCEQADRSDLNRGQLETMYRASLLFDEQGDVLFKFARKFHEFCSRDS